MKFIHLILNAELQKQIAAVKVSGEKIIRSEELKNKTTKAPENGKISL